MALDLASILAGMGETAEEVAAYLKSRGVQGVRNTVRFLNPVVRYVQAQLRVGGWSPDVMRGDALRLIHADGHKEEALLPHPVRVFLDAFNQGKYPELELPPEGQG